MEICTAVREAVGDDFSLLLDPVGAYDRPQAFQVGRLLDKLGYVAFEDPLPTSDIDGLAELCTKVDVPVHIGEFIDSPYRYCRVHPPWRDGRGAVYRGQHRRHHQRHEGGAPG